MNVRKYCDIDKVYGEGSIIKLSGQVLFLEYILCKIFEKVRSPADPDHLISLN